MIFVVYKSDNESRFFKQNIKMPMDMLGSFNLIDYNTKKVLPQITTSVNFDNIS